MRKQFGDRSAPTDYQVKGVCKKELTTVGKTLRWDHRNMLGSARSGNEANVYTDFQPETFKNP